jgi:Fe-S cluster assembly protein SufD
MSVALSPLEIFRAKGIPHRRLEDWKYSDLRSVVDAEVVESALGAGANVAITEPVEMVGLLDDELPEWATLRTQSLASGSPMEAAARAFAGGDTVLRVPSGAHVEQPLRVEFSTPGHSRIVLFVEARASLTLLEMHSAKRGGLQNVSFSIFLDEGAELTHVREAPFASDLVTVETVSVVQERNSHYRARLMSGGAKLSRTELNIALAGEGADTDLSGVTVLSDSAHADITTRIDHKVGNTTSRQLFKMVAGGHSRAVYQGKIVVHEGANGSDSRQTAKALLLGARAEANLKPELEIFADDVKCAHGAAVGDLDADSLFYLRARGIPEHEARGILVHAFLQEVVDGIEDETFRASAVEFIEAGLVRAMEVAP